MQTGLYAALRGGGPATAGELASRAKQLATAIANPSALAWADYAFGEALLDQEPDRARQALDRVVVAARAARNRFVLGVALVSVGSLHTRHGDAAQAARLLGEAVELRCGRGQADQARSRAPR